MIYLWQETERENYGWSLLGVKGLRLLWIWSLGWLYYPNVVYSAISPATQQKSYCTNRINVLVFISLNQRSVMLCRISLEGPTTMLQSKENKTKNSNSFYLFIYIYLFKQYLFVTFAPGARAHWGSLCKLYVQFIKKKLLKRRSHRKKERKKEVEDKQNRNMN